MLSDDIFFITQFIKFTNHHPLQIIANKTCHGSPLLLSTYNMVIRTVGIT